MTKQLNDQLKRESESLDLWNSFEPITVTDQRSSLALAAAAVNATWPRLQHRAFVGLQLYLLKGRLRSGDGLFKKRGKVLSIHRANSHRC